MSVARFVLLTGHSQPGRSILPDGLQQEVARFGPEGASPEGTCVLCIFYPRNTFLVSLCTPR